MGVGVGVEDVAHRDLAQGQHHPVRRLGAAQHVLVRIDLRGVPAQIEGLAQEQPVRDQIREVVADLVGLAAGKAGDPQGVAEAEALIDLRIDPDLGPGPRADPRIEGDVGGLPPAGGGVEAVGPAIGRREGQRPLVHDRGLGMEGEGLRRRVGRRFRGRGEGAGQAGGERKSGGAAPEPAKGRGHHRLRVADFRDSFGVLLRVKQGAGQGWPRPARRLRRLSRAVKGSGAA